MMILTMVAVAALPVLGAGGPLDPDPMADRGVIAETGDETHNWRDALALGTGDTYQGHLDRVNDRSDHFTVTAAQHQEVNVHVYVMGHDGVNEWLRPPTTTPPSPPAPVRASTMMDCFIYHDPVARYPLDGAYNYYYVRHYVLNIVAPVPGTHTYHVNVSINWAWTPNNYTWDYSLSLEVGPVPVIRSDEPVTGTLDMEGRDTRWYQVDAPAGKEVNGSFEILNFETGAPESRNIDVWVFADDLGGYPRSLSWDWSAAPNEPVEPFSILATYSGQYYIKLRGMNHEDVLPCTYRLEVHVQEVPAFPDTGVLNAHFDRHWHDTDWYAFEMEAGQTHPTKPGLWNEVQYFNMTERADSDDLPDFDLYLFGLAPTSRQLDLLDSSFRNDHSSFQDPDRDPNRNTEHVSAAAFYTGTYYIEVNAWNNTGFYDVRTEHKPPVLSDDNDLPGDAEPIKPGTHQGYVHQSSRGGGEHMGPVRLVQGVRHVQPVHLQAGGRRGGIPAAGRWLERAVQPHHQGGRGHERRHGGRRPGQHGPGGGHLPHRGLRRGGHRHRHRPRLGPSLRLRHRRGGRGPLRATRAAGRDLHAWCPHSAHT